MAAWTLAARFSFGIVGLSVVPEAVDAQIAASVSVATDVRLRGLSLNGGRPALTASLSYDHPSGLYGGAGATAGDSRRFGTQFLSHIAYFGFAGRISPDLALDVGIVDTYVNSNVYQRFAGRYTEAYVGLGSEHFSARLFYTPSFFASGLNAAYFDVSSNFRARPGVRVLGHAGFLVPLGGPGETVLPRARVDLRLGFAADLGRGELQLAWVWSGAGEGFLAPRRQSADALILAATWPF